MSPVIIGKLVDCTIYSFIGAGFTCTGVKLLRASKAPPPDQEKKPSSRGGIYLVVAGPIFLCLGIFKLVQALS